MSLAVARDRTVLELDENGSVKAWGEFLISSHRGHPLQYLHHQNFGM